MKIDIPKVILTYVVMPLGGGAWGAPLAPGLIHVTVYPPICPKLSRQFPGHHVRSCL